MGIGMMTLHPPSTHTHTITHFPILYSFLSFFLSFVSHDLMSYLLCFFSLSLSLFLSFPLFPSVSFILSFYHCIHSSHVHTTTTTTTAPAIGSELLATLLAGKLNDHFISDGSFITVDKSGNRSTHCHNDHCYRYSFFITTFCCLVSALVSLWIWKRRRDRQQKYDMLGR